MKTLALALVVVAAAAPAVAGSAKLVGPKQPIPYAQLDAYRKASPSERASRDWWAGSTGPAAATGSTANVSATAPDIPNDPSETDARTGVDPQTGLSSDSAAATAGQGPSSVTGAPAGPVNPTPGEAAAAETEPPS